MLLLSLFACTLTGFEYDRLFDTWGAAWGGGEVFVSFQRQDIYDKGGAGGEPIGADAITSWEMARVGTDGTATLTTVVDARRPDPYDIGKHFDAPAAVAGGHRWAGLADPAADDRAFDLYRDEQPVGTSVDTCSASLHARPDGSLALVHRRRDGGMWLVDVDASGALGPERALEGMDRPSDGDRCWEQWAPVAVGPDGDGVAVASTGPDGLLVWREGRATTSFGGEGRPKAVWASGDDLRVVESTLNGSTGYSAVSLLRGGEATLVSDYAGCIAAAFDSAGTAYVFTTYDAVATLAIAGDSVVTVPIETPYHNTPACDVFVDGDGVHLAWVEWASTRAPEIEGIPLWQATVRDGEVEVHPVVDIGPDFLVDRL